MGSQPRTRLPLARSKRRLSFEVRARFALWLLGLPVFILSAILLYGGQTPFWIGCVVLLAIAFLWWLIEVVLLDKMIRPMQTLANVVSALREEDYSFRARGARRGDALGDLALEINALGNQMQTQRLATLESTALVRQVIQSIDAPVLAFDRNEVMRVLNPAGSRVFQLPISASLGRTAKELGLESLLHMEDEQVLALMQQGRLTQWIVRRTGFRQQGVPHTLILLSDISAALREEERQAWQRLVRVMGHEINNSLTPIKSMAGTLRSRLRSSLDVVEFDRALAVIEDRADSLNRFLSAYRRLSQLPPPVVKPVPLRPLAERVAVLETLVRVKLMEAEDVVLNADADQLSQALINLVRNAAEAACEAHPEAPEVRVGWSAESTVACIQVLDNGHGVANLENLFVPFYTTKATGSGVGLALAKQIAEGHSGSLSLRNRDDGGGAVAELRIPLAQR